MLLLVVMWLFMWFSLCFFWGGVIFWVSLRLLFLLVFLLDILPLWAHFDHYDGVLADDKQNAFTIFYGFSVPKMISRLAEQYRKHGVNLFTLAGTSLAIIFLIKWICLNISETFSMKPIESNGSKYGLISVCMSAGICTG